MTTRRILALLTALALLLPGLAALAEAPTAADIDLLLKADTDTALIQSPLLAPIQEARNSVVSVNVYSGPPRGRVYTYDDDPAITGGGSGTVVSPWGHILTNAHVVQGEQHFAVESEDILLEAYLVHQNLDLDLAVLFVPGLKLPQVTFGDSDKLQVGEWAIVIGTPVDMNFERTVNIGVVSGLNRIAQGLPQEDPYGLDMTKEQVMIQTSAAINPGMSGGGLFNSLGQLVGVPTMKVFEMGGSTEPGAPPPDDTPVDNLGLCIPIKLALPLIREVLEQFDGKQQPLQKTGEEEMTGPRFGGMLYALDDNFPPRKSKSVPRGLLVEAVEEDSPAARAGIRAGDILVDINGSVVADFNDLDRIMPGLKAGDSARIKVYRVRGLMDIFNGTSQDMYLPRGRYIDLDITFE